MTKRDYKYFNKAKLVALLSDYHEIQIGCVAVYQSHIIGFGYNCNKTHPIQEFYNRYRKDYTRGLLPKLHAEINCINSIRNLGINFSKVKLYIYRIRKDQPFGLSRPCLSCMAAIKDTGIRDIYYTSNEGYIHECLGKEKGCYINV